MDYKVYIIDDTPEKTARLPQFIKWLGKNFPKSKFIAGFDDPNNASSNPDDILRALNDPRGLMLLDVFMDSQRHQEAATKIRKLFKVNARDFGQVHKELHSKAGTMLAAAIVCVARTKGCRVVWISNQNVDGNLSSAISAMSYRFDNIGWYWDAKNNWTNAHKESVAKVLAHYHDDQALNDAIAFCAFGPQPDIAWNHDKLASGGSHYAAIKKWLGLKALDSNSAKALLLGVVPGNPSVVKLYDDDYPSHPAVIQAVCKKLGIAFGGSFKKQSINLPVQPGLPFLIALGSLISQMKKCDKFYPPKKIELDTNGSNWTLTLSLHEMRKDQPAVLINMADFEKRYNTAKAKKKSVKSGRKPAHLTTASLIDLLHARVELPKGNQLGSLFEGMTGEAVTIEFNKTAGAQAIIIKWPNPNS